MGRAGLFDAGKDQVHANTRYRSISSESFDSLAQKALDGSGPMLLDTFMSSGIRTLCEMPQIGFSDDDGGASSVDSSLPPVASVLVSLRNQCMRHIDGWWTYEFCVGKQLRQYHADMHGKIEKEYLLGSAVYKPTTPGRLEHTIDTSSMNSEQFLAHLDSLQVANDAGTPFYSEHYDNGTPCDVTSGTPRQFEARWSCAPGIAASAIRSVKEPASCRYILEVDSPLLCEHPSYRSSETPLYTMTCYFVDKEAISATKERKEKLSSKEQVALDQQWLESNIRAMKSPVKDAAPGAEGSATQEGQAANAAEAATEGSIENRAASTAPQHGEDDLGFSITHNNIPGLSTGATFVMRSVDEESVDDTYLLALHTSAVLRDTVRERTDKVSLAVLNPSVSNEADATASGDESEDDYEIVTGPRLEQLLSRLSDADLLTLISTMDEAILISDEEHAALQAEGIEFDPNEKIVLELDTTGHPLPWDHHINPQDDESDQDEQKQQL